MKIAALIARLLLGLTFVVFGLDKLVHFIPGTPPTVGPAGAFIGGLMHSHYIHCIGVVEVIGGLLLLIGQFIPLGLVLLGPVIFNITVFHLTMEPSGAPLAAILILLWTLVAYRYRSYFLPFFVRTATPTP